MAEQQSRETAKPPVPAIFLDKDGVIVDNSMYPEPPMADVLPEALEGLRLIAKSGYKAVVVSNQSWIGKGRLTEDEVEGVFSALREKAAALGLDLDYYYCPHDKKELCACRKPSPALILQAAKDLNIDLSGSFMVGDQTSDILAGERAGVKTILVRTGEAGKDGKHEVVPHIIADDLTHAMKIITGGDQR